MAAKRTGGIRGVIVLGAFIGAVAGGSGPAPVAAQQCLRWEQQQDIGPPPRAFHSAAMDPVRRRLVVFGGRSEWGLHADTWEWDGAQWSNRSGEPGATTPPARRGTAMWFDPLTQRVMMFGGQGSLGPLADTWSWDGQVWSPITATPGPAARTSHAIAYDPDRQQAVLFGGSSGASTLADTWTWTASTGWQVIAAAGPGGRAGHALVFDPTLRRVLLLGGSATGAGAFSWNGSAWQAEPLTGSPEPWRHGAAAAGVGPDRIWLFGGRAITGQQTWSRLRSLGASGWALRTEGAPGARRGATLTRWDDRLVLLGGEDRNGNLETAWWTLSPGQAVPAHIVQQPVGVMAVSTAPVVLTAAVGGSGPLTVRWQRDGVDLIDGQGVSGAATTSLRLAEPAERAGRYRLRVSNGCGVVESAEAVVTAPACPPRWVGGTIAASAAASVDVDWYHEKLLRFGGVRSGGTQDDRTYLCGQVGCEQLATASPPWRRNAGMATPEGFWQASRTVLYGGLDGNGNPLGDTWLWFRNGWVELTAPGPGERAGHAMSRVALSNLASPVLMFGGENVAGIVLGDTWVWSQAGWEARAEPGPSARKWAAMVYDHQRAVVVLHGGMLADGTIADDTWEYDANGWRRRDDAGGPALAGQQMGYDQARGVMVMMGGRRGAGGLSSEWWEYGGDRWVLVPPANDPRPSPSRDGAMAFNPATRSLVLLTGFTSNQESAATPVQWELAAEPSFSVRPRERELVVPGSTATLYAVASAGSAVTYQWFRNGEPLVASSRVLGVNTSQLLISRVNGLFEGVYWLRATTEGGCTAISGRTVLSFVHRPCGLADISGTQGGNLADGQLTGEDFAAFLQGFAAGTVAADVTGIGGPPELPDGLVTGDDLVAFVAAFASGCP
jgi:hypothetical protein